MGRLSSLKLTLNSIHTAHACDFFGQGPHLKGDSKSNPCSELSAKCEPHIRTQEEQKPFVCDVKCSHTRAKRLSVVDTHLLAPSCCCYRQVGSVNMKGNKIHDRDTCELQVP